jgi:hypothetical protein
MTFAYTTLRIRRIAPLLLIVQAYFQPLERVICQFTGCDEQIVKAPSIGPYSLQM